MQKAKRGEQSGTRNASEDEERPSARYAFDPEAQVTQFADVAALEMPTLIELGSHARGMRTNPRDHGASTAVCEGPLDKEQRRRPPELEELQSERSDNRRPSQAGRAARPQ